MKGAPTMAGERILVVEDEANISRLIRAYLERDGYVVTVSGDGEQAWRDIQTTPPDLVLLDLMLPKVDGWELCRRIRSRPGAAARLPVIMLSAKSEEFDRVLGLELGADDYVPKPFSPRELVARVRAVLRRASPPPDDAGAGESTAAKILAFPDFVINPASRELIVRGSVVPCPAKEFDLLWLLASNPDHVFSREHLLERVWDYEYFGDARTVDVHIRRVRQKIEPDPANPRYIQTVWGVGYKLTARNAGGH